MRVSCSFNITNYHLIFESRSRLVTRVLTPCAWFSMKTLPLHHSPTISILTLATLGRTLHETRNGDPFPLYPGPVVDPAY